MSLYDRIIEEAVGERFEKARAEVIAKGVPATELDKILKSILASGIKGSSRNAGVRSRAVEAKVYKFADFNALNPLLYANVLDNDRIRYYPTNYGVGVLSAYYGSPAEKKPAKPRKMAWFKVYQDGPDFAIEGKKFVGDPNKGEPYHYGHMWMPWAEAKHYLITTYQSLGGMSFTGKARSEFFAGLRALTQGDVIERGAESGKRHFNM